MSVEFFPRFVAPLREASSLKRHVRPYAGGDERCSRRRLGPLNLLGGEIYTQDIRLDGPNTNSETKTKIAKRGRRA